MFFFLRRIHILMIYATIEPSIWVRRMENRTSKYTHTSIYFLFNRYMNKFAFHYQNCLSLNNDVADLIPFHVATGMFPHTYKRAHIDVFWMEIVMEIYRIYTFDTRQRIYLYGNANASVLNVLLGVLFAISSSFHSCHFRFSLCEQKGIINLFFNFTWNENIYINLSVHTLMDAIVLHRLLLLFYSTDFLFFLGVFASTFRSIPLSIILQFKKRWRERKLRLLC